MNGDRLPPDALWLFIEETELFLPFNDFPWFTVASIAEVTRVEMPSPHHGRSAWRCRLGATRGQHG